MNSAHAYRIFVSTILFSPSLFLFLLFTALKLSLFERGRERRRKKRRWRRPRVVCLPSEICWIVCGIFAILLRHDYNDYITAQPPLAWDLAANVNIAQRDWKNILGRSSMPEKSLGIRLVRPYCRRHRRLIYLGLKFRSVISSSSQVQNLSLDERISACTKRETEEERKIHRDEIATQK